MAERLQLVPPTDLYLRLSVVEGLTGVPTSTMAQAIKEGDLHALQLSQAWHTRLGDVNAWIEAQGKGRGELDKAAVGQVATHLADLRPQARGERMDQAGSPLKPARKPRKEKRCAPGKRQLVYDIRPRLAEEAGEATKPDDA